jgi:hypothetical protein
MKLLDKILYLTRNSFNIPTFLYEYVKFKNGYKGVGLDFLNSLPILNEKTELMGYDSHYVYHTAWAARKIRDISPLLHVDISSSLMFCGIISSFVKCFHYDYRAPLLELENLSCGSENLTSLTFSDGSISSLSCMHVIEHIGLGRYGDPIDPSGDAKACNELTRVLAKDGFLIIVLPVAEKRMVRFNAHRVYEYREVIKLFSNLELIEFSFLNDSLSDKFFENASPKNIIGSKYGCGCFVFRK